MNNDNNDNNNDISYTPDGHSRATNDHGDGDKHSALPPVDVLPCTVADVEPPRMSSAESYRRKKKKKN